MNKSEIKVGIVRKIRTADFEQLDVISEIREIIEWKNEEERSKKADKINKHLISDFTKTYNAVIETIGVKRSLGTATLTKEDGSIHTANAIADDEIDMFGD